MSLTITPQSTIPNLSPLIFQDSPLSNQATGDGSKPLQWQKTTQLQVSPIGSSFFRETLPKPSMSHKQQDEFTADVCRLLIICNITWWAVDQPYWRAFFQKWQPAAYMPGRKELSGHILNEEAEKVKGKMKWKVKGHYGLGQNDGWKNIVKTSLIASMVIICYIVSQIWFLILEQSLTSEITAIFTQYIRCVSTSQDSRYNAWFHARWN